MAKSKAELMAEKMRQQQIGKAAFEVGSKPAVETQVPVAEVEPVITSAPTHTTTNNTDDLNNYVFATRTQGRKGQKVPRMNLGIPEDVYEYIRRESRKQGMTYSEFICAVMRQRRDNNK